MKKKCTCAEIYATIDGSGYGGDMHGFDMRCGVCQEEDWKARKKLRLEHEIKRLQKELKELS